MQVAWRGCQPARQWTPEVTQNTGDPHGEGTGQVTNTGSLCRQRGRPYAIDPDCGSDRGQGVGADGEELADRGSRHRHRKSITSPDRCPRDHSRICTARRLQTVVVAAGRRQGPDRVGLSERSHAVTAYRAHAICRVSCMRGEDFYRSMGCVCC
jgi:hypothetical protein